MKIAITTSGSDLDAPLDSRFGRAPKFLIYYSDLGTYHVQNNEQNLNATQGAGIQSALHLCDEKVDCVITGNCGPKAYATLSAANISVYTVENTTVGEAIEMLKCGSLTEPDVISDNGVLKTLLLSRKPLCGAQKQKAA